MANFSYRVINKEGKEKKGSIQADTKENAIAALRAEGNTIISVDMGSILNTELSFGKKKVKSRDLSIFCRQFNSLLAAGVGVVSGLEMLAEQTENKVMREAVQNVHDSVQKGDTLANAMKKEEVFPGILVSMMEAGEASGNIETSLIRMSEHFEKDTKVKGMLKKAMIYPIILLVVAIGVLVVMVVGVLPSFASMFADMDSSLPPLTVGLLNLSDFLKTKWYIIIIAIVAIVVAFKMYKKNPDGARQIAALKLKLPGVGKLITKTACSRFARTFSTMLASGMPMVEAMAITSKTMDNLLFKDALDEATIQVQRGVQLSQVLKKSGLFPPLIIHMVGIGEETGNLEDMLNNAAKYYDEEVELATQQVMAMMEPMIIIVMAGIVCVILGAIYGPVIKMFDTLGAM